MHTLKSAMLDDTLADECDGNFDGADEPRFPTSSTIYQSISRATPVLNGTYIGW